MPDALLTPYLNNIAKACNHKGDNLVPKWFPCTPQSLLVDWFPSPAQYASGAFRYHG